MALSTVDRPDLGPPPATTGRAVPQLSLDRLAAELAELTEHDTDTLTLAWAAIVHLEQILDIPLGAPDDYLVALWRRFARIDRRLRSASVGHRELDDAAAIALELLATMR